MGDKVKNGWRKVKLGEIAKEVRETYEPTPNEDLRYIGLEHIEQQTLRFSGTGISSATQSTKKIFEYNDILFGSLRAYFRKVVKPKFSGVCSTDITVIRSKENCHQGFLFYFIANQDFIDFATNWSSGTRMPRANWNVLSNSEWLFPSYDNQRKIASILSVYDDLIENNTRRIQILEEMAQAIYKEWFVNFRFPGHEKVKMVESDLGLIPEGWEIAHLGEIIEIYKGKKAKNIYSLPENNRIAYLLIDGIKNHSFLYTDDRDRALCEKNDVLMVMDGASSGQVYIGYEGYVGSTLAIFRVKSQVELSQHLLFYLLKSTFKSISDNNVGSAIPHANKEFIKSMRIMIPTSVVNQKAHLNFLEIHQYINILKEKNGILQKFRDRLLPKLISGEIDV